jgi:hypothetical protein
MPSRTRSLACKNESTRASHHRQGGIIQRFLRNGFNGCFELSPVIGLSCHRRQRNAQHYRSLDISVEISGPHVSILAFGETRRS